MSGIVVGVDGSELSRAALTWAFTQARLTGSTLTAVTAWQHPELFALGAVPLPSGEPTDYEAIRRERLEETLAEVLGDDAATVQTHVAEGSPAKVLLDAAADADLLVVGSHGHGAFEAVLVGSVSERCVRMAKCPVVVVR